MRLLLPEARTLSDADLLELYAPGPGPSLRLGFVLSVDGAVAVEGSSLGLGTPADKAVFRTLRAVCDAVVVGAGTARAEDYGPVVRREAALQWRAAHGRPATSPLVVVSASGALHPRARVFGGDVRPLLVVPASARLADGLRDVADVVVAGDDAVDLAAALDDLRDRGYEALLCEGGPTLATDLLAAGLVDELCLTTSPRLVGGGPPLLTGAAAADLALASLVADDDGTLLARWTVTTP